MSGDLKVTSFHAKTSASVFDFRGGDSPACADDAVAVLSHAKRAVDEVQQTCNVVPNQPVISGSGASHEVWVTNDETTLHVLAVYEPALSNNDINVDFGLASGDHALVLSSYDAANWRITKTGNSKITKVVVFGYHMQTVTGVSSSIVEIHCYDCSPRSSGPFCGYAWPDDKQGKFGFVSVSIESCALESLTKRTNRLSHR